MMKERPKPNSKENHSDTDARLSTGAQNVEKKLLKSVDPLELLEKRLAKLSEGLASEISATDQVHSTETIGTSTERSVFPIESQESVKITKLALLKRIEDSRERARFTQQKLREKDEMGRQEQQHREATVVQQQQQQETETCRLMNVSAPSNNEMEADVARFSEFLHEEKSSAMRKKESIATSKYSPSAPPAEDASELNCRVEDIGYYYPEIEGDSPPPPSYEEFELSVTLVEPTIYSQEEAPDTAASFVYDAFGNLITSEEKQRIEDEQRRILEMILREKSEREERKAIEISNGTPSSSIAESIDRLPSAILSPVSQHPSAATATSLSAAISTTPTLVRNPQTNLDSGSLVQSQSSFRTVTVGPGKQIQVHDQTKTREAILRGTAVLVECVSCSKWMQVADSAKLMYCPCCESVVPVIPQYKVKTQDEAIRITRDRQLAERLQSEYSLENDNSGANNVQSGHSDGELTFNSWREYVTAIFSTAPKPSGNQQSEANPHDSTSKVFSYAAEGRCTQESKEDGGNPVSQVRPQLYSPKIYGNDQSSRSNEEEESTSFLPARVASQQQNLFSCVEKSFSTVFSSMGRFGYGGEEKIEEVDEELLALTNHNLLLREETTNSSEYHRIFDYEDENCQKS